ncbi:Non-specific lipid-transfer protein [Thalictrum thalictroides]|uniref:Non-specific lipid-transfer protein n=1 Tax=Thalictrum thalictroides TaxID=46969 RepID=A0A7J6X2V8_THATH|nr:Non-specific lipid-transfer protein [Thalictrum thalictroides]
MKGVMMIIGVLVVFSMVQVMVKPIEAFTCQDIAVILKDCSAYATGKIPNPPAGCCNGVKQLEKMGVTKTDQQQICGCLKTACTTYPDVKEAACLALPGKCNAKFPFKVSKSAQCNW